MMNDRAMIRIDAEMPLGLVIRASRAVATASRFLPGSGGQARTPCGSRISTRRPQGWTGGGRQFHTTRRGMLTMAGGRVMTGAARHARGIYEKVL